MAVMQITRTSVPGGSPVAGSLQPGQLAIEMATPTRLWVGVPNTIDPVNMQKLLYDSSAAGGGLADAPSDTFFYGRKDATWVQGLPLTGGAMVGPVSFDTGFLPAITTPDAPAGSNTSGTDFAMRIGAGDGSRAGGSLSLYGGNAGATALGGSVGIYGGQGGTASGNGGSAIVYGGAAYALTPGMKAGDAEIRGGDSQLGIGGDAVVSGGRGLSGAAAVGGNVVLMSAPGNTILSNIIIDLQSAMTVLPAGHFQISPLRDALDDTAAAAAGVPLNGVYHNAGALRIRIV